MKQGKHYVDSKKLVDRTKLYESSEALALCCQTAKAKFDETVELHVRLGVDSRHADQQVRGAVVLPNGTGKNVRVVAIAKGDAAKAAEEAGAMMVGDADLVAKIQNEGFIDFDVLVTTPDMMGLVGRLGKILGPRGLMPNPKAGTVTPDVGRAVTEAKAGKIEYRLDKANIIHVPIGKASFGAEKLEENLKVVMEAIVKAKPAAAKRPVYPQRYCGLYHGPRHQAEQRKVRRLSVARFFALCKSAWAFRPLWLGSSAFGTWFYRTPKGWRQLRPFSITFLLEKAIYRRGGTFSWPFAAEI